MTICSLTQKIVSKVGTLLNLLGTDRCFRPYNQRGQTCVGDAKLQVTGRCSENDFFPIFHQIFTPFRSISGSSVVSR